MGLMGNQALIASHTVVFVPTGLVAANECDGLAMQLTRFEVVVLERSVGEVGLKLQGLHLRLPAQHVAYQLKNRVIKSEGERDVQLREEGLYDLEGQQHQQH